MGDRLEYMLSKQNAIQQVYNSLAAEDADTKLTITVDGRPGALRGIEGGKTLVRMIHRHGVDSFELISGSRVERIRLNYFAKSNT